MRQPATPASARRPNTVSIDVQRVQAEEAGIFEALASDCELVITRLIEASRRGLISTKVGGGLRMRTGQKPTG